MLGPVGDDEFPEFYDFKPSAPRSQIQEFTEDDAYDLLFGDGSGDGHYAFGEASKTASSLPVGEKTR